MGRAPCCDKANVKKGPWSPEEDAKLKSYIEKHGTGGNWIALPQKIGLNRCGKSCRLRWLNYLRPNLKHGGFSEEEDNIICSLYISIGSRWSIIAAQLPGRTDNDIKNYWNTKLKKKLLGKHRKEQRNRGNNGVVKQESNIINRGSGGSSDSLSFVPENINHHNLDEHPYFQQRSMLPIIQPLPYTNQSPCFNDQDSIKKVLIKLGGRFSNDYYNNYHPSLDGLLMNNHHQFSNSIYNYYQDQFHHMVSSYNCISNSTNVNNNNEVVQYEYGLDLVQGQGSTFPFEIEEMVSSTTNCPQRLDELEFLYGEDMIVNDKIVGSSSTTTTTFSQSINWGETRSQIYHPVVASTYQDQGLRQQETPQECALQQELTYSRAHQ